MDPGDIVADFGVDARVALLGTSNPPRDNALELPVADHGTTGVSLEKKEKSSRLSK